MIICSFWEEGLMSNMIRLDQSWTFLHTTHYNWLICWLLLSWFGVLSEVSSDSWHDLSKRSWSCYCHHQWSGRRKVSFIRKLLLWRLSMPRIGYSCLLIVCRGGFKMLSVKHLTDAWSEGAEVTLLLNTASCLPFRVMISKTIFHWLPVSCHRSIGCPTMSESAAVLQQGVTFLHSHTTLIRDNNTVYLVRRICSQTLHIPRHLTPCNLLLPSFAKIFAVVQKNSLSRYDVNWRCGHQ